MRFVILAALSALLPGAAPVGAADLPVHVGHHATTPQDELVEGGKVWNYGDAQSLGDRFGAANPAPMIGLAAVPGLKP